MKDMLNKHQQILNEVVTGITSHRFYEFNLSEIFSTVSSDEKIWVLGAGKASLEMAAQAENHFSDIEDGIVIAPQKSKMLDDIQVFAGSHPYPDEDSVASSLELIALARKIPKNATVLFLLSGGASSLFCVPSKGIELDELQQTFKLLLNSGASIHDINVIRKHLSDSAGGRLGEILSDCNLVSVILSDVPGDNPESIGSGPTVPDSSTFKHAFQLLKQLRLWDAVPHSIRIHISKGMHGDVPETAKPDVNLWPHHRKQIISGAGVLAKNVADYLTHCGYSVKIMDEAYNDEVKKVVEMICDEAISSLNEDSKKPRAFVYFGESTIQVQGDGEGGRNQELALYAAKMIENKTPISLLSFGTDGLDGPTDAAGAIVNSETMALAKKANLDTDSYLQNNDTYNFHRQMNTLIKTGPTGNNLMDLQVVLVG